jgi:ribonuclease HI
MVYKMDIYAGGGCRRNGQAGSVGAAAVVFYLTFGHHRACAMPLPNQPVPTSRRAEFTVIVLVLE